MPPKIPILRTDLVEERIGNLADTESAVQEGATASTPASEAPASVPDNLAPTTQDIIKRARAAAAAASQGPDSPLGLREFKKRRPSAVTGEDTHDFIKEPEYTPSKQDRESALFSPGGGPLLAPVALTPRQSLTSDATPRKSSAHLETKFMFDALSPIPPLRSEETLGSGEVFQFQAHDIPSPDLRDTGKGRRQSLNGMKNPFRKKVNNRRQSLAPSQALLGVPPSAPIPPCTSGHRQSVYTIAAAHVPVVALDDFLEGNGTKEMCNPKGRGSTGAIESAIPIPHSSGAMTDRSHINRTRSLPRDGQSPENRMQRGPVSENRSSSVFKKVLSPRRRAMCELLLHFDEKRVGVVSKDQFLRAISTVGLESRVHTALCNALCRTFRENDDTDSVGYMEFLGWFGVADTLQAVSQQGLKAQIDPNRIPSVDEVMKNSQRGSFSGLAIPGFDEIGMPKRICQSILSHCVDTAIMVGYEKERLRMEHEPNRKTLVAASELVEELGGHDIMEYLRRVSEENAALRLSLKESEDKRLEEKRKRKLLRQRVREINAENNRVEKARADQWWKTHALQNELASAQAQIEDLSIKLEIARARTLGVAEEQFAIQKRMESPEPIKHQTTDAIAEEISLLHLNNGEDRKVMESPKGTKRWGIFRKDRTGRESKETVRRQESTASMASSLSRGSSAQDQASDNYEKENFAEHWFQIRSCGSAIRLWMEIITKRRSFRKLLLVRSSRRSSLSLAASFMRWRLRVCCQKMVSPLPNPFVEAVVAKAENFGFSQRALTSVSMLAGILEVLGHRTAGMTRGSIRGNLDEESSDDDLYKLVTVNSHEDDLEDEDPQSPQRVVRLSKASPPSNKHISPHTYVKVDAENQREKDYIAVAGIAAKARRPNSSI